MWFFAALSFVVLIGAGAAIYVFLWGPSESPTDAVQAATQNRTQDTTAATQGPAETPTTFVDPCVEAVDAIGAILTSVAGEALTDSTIADVDTLLTTYRDSGCSGVDLGSPQSAAGLALAIGMSEEMTVRQVIASASVFVSQLSVVPSAESGLPGPAWIAILDSLEVGEYSQVQASNKAAEHARTVGLPASYVNSSDYLSLNDGYWAVHMGPYVDRGAAVAACEAARTYDLNCYDRYLAPAPVTGDAFPSCGEFSSVTATVSADARTGPTELRGVLRTTSAGQQYLAAGPAHVNDDGVLWQPIVIGSDIVWVKASSVARTAGCPEPVPLDCPGLKAMAVENQAAIVSAATSPAVAPDTAAAARLQYAVDRGTQMGCLNATPSPRPANPGSTLFQRLIAALAA